MMFKTFALTLFIFIQNSVAGATGPVINRCETVFERIQTETRNQDPEISFKRSPSIHWGDQGNYVGRLLDIDKLRQLPVSENPITMLPQTITFELGGRLRILKSETGEWCSAFRPNDRDVIGNPSFLAQIAGARFGFALGFRQAVWLDVRGLSKSGKYLMTVPDAAALDSAIGIINARLQTKDLRAIPIKFYEVDVSRPLTGAEYAERFLQGELPLEKKGPIAIHDISYHAAAIFLPPLYVERMQTLVRFALNFANLIRAQDPDRADAIIDQTNKRIDELGNISAGLAFLSGGSKDGMDHIAVGLTTSGIELQPRDFVRTLLKKIKAPLEFDALLKEMALPSMPQAKSAHNFTLAAFERIEALRASVLHDSSLHIK